MMEVQAMFRHILVLLDPAHPEPSALQLATELARRHGGDMTLLTVLNDASLAMGHMPELESEARKEALEDQRLAAQQVHRQAIQEAERHGVLAFSTIGNSQSPVKAILAAAQASNSDAIVLVSDGGNAVTRILKGSAVPGLVTGATVPVMVCPVQWAAAQVQLDQTRLLVCLDDSEAGAYMRRTAVTLGRILAAELLFVHIDAAYPVPLLDPTGFVPTTGETAADMLQGNSRRILAAAATHATKAGLKSRGLSLPPGSSAKNIAQLAASRGCALVMVQHRGGNAVQRLLTGSLIPGLITAAETPILICREPEHSPKPRNPRRSHSRNRAAAAAARDRAL